MKIFNGKKMNFKCKKCGSKLVYTIRHSKIHENYKKELGNGKTEIGVNFGFDELKCKCGYILKIPRIL